MRSIRSEETKSDVLISRSEPVTYPLNIQLEEPSHMAGPQYVYTMQGLSKAYPGGKKVFENIHLSFLPDAKIGVVGVLSLIHI